MAKKISRLRQAAFIGEAIGHLHRFARITDDLFENLEIVEIAPAPERGYQAKRLGPVVREALDKLDDALLLQHGQMPAQVAVRQPTHPLEIAEHDALGAGDEGGENAQARALMKDAVEPFIGEGSRVRHARSCSSPTA